MQVLSVTIHYTDDTVSETEEQVRAASLGKSSHRDTAPDYIRQLLAVLEAINGPGQESTLTLV